MSARVKRLVTDGTRRVYVLTSRTTGGRPGLVGAATVVQSGAVSARGVV